jgi:hypothetical protein
MTAEPVFINTINSGRYGASENLGRLVQPGESFDYANYGEGFRVRNMRGETVLYSAGDLGEDLNYNISSLEADPSAPRVGQPFSWGLAPRNPWSATVCDDGHSRNIKEFGLRVDVRNYQGQPLVLEIFERFSDTDEPPDVWGVFVPSGGIATASDLIVTEPWLRAFDQTGALVYTARLTLTETQTVSIPAGPLTVGEIPRQNIGRQTGLGTDCGFPNVWIALLALNFAGGASVGAIGLFILWRRRGGRYY